MAEGASQSRVQISAKLESTRGTTPSNPDYTVCPIAAGSFLQVDQNFEQSTLLRADRARGASVGGTSSVSGTLNAPAMAEAGFRLWLESALSNGFSAVTRSSVTVTFAASGTTITRASGSWLTEAVANRFEIGDIIFPSGTTNNQTLVNDAANITSAATTITVDSTTPYESTGVIKIDNEIITYTGKTSTTFTGCTRGAYGTTAATHNDNAPVLHGLTISNISALVITCATNTAIVNETSVSTAFTTNVRVLVPGTTRKFYTVEQQFADITYYEIFKGVELNTLQVNIPTSGPITTAIGVVGTKYATGQVSGSTYAALAGRSEMASSVTGALLTVNGSALGTCIVSITLNINNNRAPKSGVGEQFACFVEEGTRTIDLSFSAYLVDGTEQTKFQAGTTFALAATTVSSGGDKLQWRLPKLKYTQAPKGVDGQSVVENFQASAEYDSTSGYDMWIREVFGA